MLRVLFIHRKGGSLMRVPVFTNRRRARLTVRRMRARGHPVWHIARSLQLPRRVVENILAENVGSWR